jgi:hypothetical protein
MANVVRDRMRRRITTHIDSRPQGRYSNLLDDVFSLFASQEWIDEGFLVVPKEHVTDKKLSEYGRFSIITNGEGFKDSLSGIMYIDIFTPNGVGPKRAYQLADILDKYFAGQSLTTQNNVATTQFRRESNFEPRGVDSKNTALFHSTFQIQFSYFRKEK